MTTKSNVDVLIIGAGPAGLMCANGLARAGVNVRIVDQRWACEAAGGVIPSLVSADPLLVRSNHLNSRPAMIAAGQADGIQPRTIEVLQVRHRTWCE